MVVLKLSLVHFQLSRNIVITGINEHVKVPASSFKREIISSAVSTLAIPNSYIVLSDAEYALARGSKDFPRARELNRQLFDIFR